MEKKSGIIIASLASCALVAGIVYAKNPFAPGQSSQPAEADSVSDAAAETTNETSAAAETAATSAAETEATTAANEGGADAAAEKTVFAVTVSEQKYYLDNQEISMEDLTKKLEETQGEIAVEITDDHGAVNAFDDLTALLNEKQISYTIKETE